MTDQPAYVTRAEYVGYDHGATVAIDAYLMSTETARRIDDGDMAHAADEYRWPNLSGEFADDPTPRSIAAECGAPIDDYDAVDACADAWEEHASEAFAAMLRASAARVLGNVERAMSIERDVDAKASTLRAAADAL